MYCFSSGRPSQRKAPELSCQICRLTSTAQAGTAPCRPSPASASSQEPTESTGHRSTCPGSLLKTTSRPQHPTAGPSIPAQLMGTPGTRAPGHGVGRNHRQLFPRRGSHPGHMQLRVSLAPGTSQRRGTAAPKLSLQGQAAQEASRREASRAAVTLGKCFMALHHHRLQRQHLHQREALLPAGPPVSYTWELTLLREQSPAGPQTGSATGVPFSGRLCGHRR